jgi:hypothetical protein
MRRARCTLNRKLTKPGLPRLLKKVQMQGGTRRAGHPPQVGQGVLEVRRSECPSVPTQQMGLFQQPAGGRSMQCRTRQCQGERRRAFLFALPLSLSKPRHSAVSHLNPLTLSPSKGEGVQRRRRTHGPPYSAGNRGGGERAIPRTALAGGETGRTAVHGSGLPGKAPTRSCAPASRLQDDPYGVRTGFALDTILPMRQAEPAGCALHVHRHTAAEAADGENRRK